MNNLIFDWGGKDVLSLPLEEQTRIYLNILYPDQDEVYIRFPFIAYNPSFALRYPQIKKLDFSAIAPKSVLKQKCIDIIHKMEIPEMMIMLGVNAFQFMRIESDSITLLEQFNALNKMHEEWEEFKSMVQCCFFSGKRSVHCILKIPNPYKENYFSILDRIKSQYMPEVDLNLGRGGLGTGAKCDHFTRIVGGKRDNGEITSLLYLK